MICVEVALKAEARPLIEAFELKPLSGNHLFPIWENDQIKLIISGVGKVKAGAACSYLAAIHRDEDIYGWINIGIGGHQAHRVGTPFLIHKIIDTGRRSSFFPSFAFTPPCQTELCLTVENPEHKYEKPYVYDMEAAGFYAIASKLAPLEMIHVFKVISDNLKTPATDVTKKCVEKLIADQVDLLKKILKEMRGLIDDIAPVSVPFLDECLKTWHFTTCETHQLKNLLQRWQHLCPDHVLFSQDFTNQKSAKDVLQFLEKHLEHVSLPPLMTFVYIEEEVRDHPKTLEVIEKINPCQIISIERHGEVFNRKSQNFRLQKRGPSFILAKKYGTCVYPTPATYGIGAKENYYFSHLLNCPFDCRYCFLQGMYRSASFVLFVNYQDFQTAIEEKIGGRKNNIFLRL